MTTEAGTVTSEAISDRLAELREAGAKLRRRPARETTEALGRVFDAWNDPHSRWRRALEARLPQAAGFSAPMVREGLRRGFSRWSGRALEELVVREIGGADHVDAAADPLVCGFDVTAVLLAGSIPMPSVLALLAPLVLRSPVLAKTASRDPVTAPLVARSIAAADAELGSCVEIVSFPGDDPERIASLLEADCVVASGSDATIGAVAPRVAAPRRLVSYGHRLSVAALATTRAAGLASAAERLALDVALWDQLGCLSPVAVYVVDSDPGAVDRVAEALALALETAEERWPRGVVSVHAAALAAHERADAELRAAAGRRVALQIGASGEWTVIREDTATPRSAPLHRFVRVHPVGDVGGLVDALRPLGPHLAAVALEGFGARTAELTAALARLGASRICRPGTLQSPPLDWGRGERGVLLPLARVGSLELDTTGGSRSRSDSSPDSDGGLDRDLGRDLEGV